MKFTILRNVFVKALRDVKKGSLKDKAIPMLSGTVKIIAGLDHLLLSVYGDFSVMTKKINSGDLKISEMGGIVVSLSALIKILPKLEGKEVTIYIHGKDVNIMTDDTTFTLSGEDQVFSVSEMPDTPKEPKDNKITANGDDVKKGLNSTLRAVSKQESRPLLTGVHFTVRGQNMSMVSTDSHQLAYDKIKINNPLNKRLETTIRGKSIKPFYQLMDVDKPLNIKQLENVTVVNQSKLKLLNTTLEGEYPDIRQLLPRTFNQVLTVNRLEFKREVNQVKAIASLSKAFVIELHYKDHKAYLTAMSPEVGKVETKVKMISDQGRDLVISFNPDYVLNALRGYKGVKNVDLKFVSPLRPFVVKPHDEDNRLNLVTPIRTF